MANGHGGYRQPSNPAPVSGPGALSKRTDGQVLSAAPDQGYGEAGQQMNDQRTQPMGAAKPLPPMPNVPAGGQPGTPPQNQPYSGGEFAAPSGRPNEPVTAGVPIGPGAGPEALRLGAVNNSPVAPATGQMTQLLSSLMGTDTTGVMAQLLQQAQARGA